MSEDGSDWHNIYSTTTGDGGKDEILLTSSSGRYIRLLMTERGTIYGYSLWEIEIWNSDEVIHPVNNLLSNVAVVTVSSVQAPFEKESLVDGNNGTRWASAQGDDNEWVIIDLGQSAHITELVLNWEAAYGTAYRIFVSDDGLSWYEAYATTTGKGGIENIPLTTTGRYLKFQGESRATIYGYSLWELEVYGY
ncbi:MAG TPA: discoidin domain-containing protein [Candidatus Paenibacillus intestinavium]|nr:discoidin domain-containing protein [Candidatus Paenibacillus intestinavium]